MVRNKLGRANKFSTKASSVDDILLQEEEEAFRRQNEMTLLPEDDNRTRMETIVKEKLGQVKLERWRKELEKL